MTYLVLGHCWLKLLSRVLGPVKTKRRSSGSWKRLIPIALCWEAMPGPGASQFCTVATRHSASLLRSPHQTDRSTSRKRLEDSVLFCLCLLYPVTDTLKLSEQSLDLGVESGAACCLLPAPLGLQSPCSTWPHLCQKTKPLLSLSLRWGMAMPLLNSFFQDNNYVSNWS